jgi:hypothetical protein
MKCFFLVLGPDRIEHVIEDVRQMKRAHNVHDIVTPSPSSSSIMANNRNGSVPQLINGPTSSSTKTTSSSNPIGSYSNHRHSHDQLHNGEPSRSIHSNMTSRGSSIPNTSSMHQQQQHHDR